MLVSISDLLGTAGLEAKAADRIIESIRDGSTSSRLASIDDAHECAVQLLSEIEVARNHIHGFYSRTKQQPTNEFLTSRQWDFETPCESVAEGLRGELERYHDDD